MRKQPIAFFIAYFIFALWIVTAIYVLFVRFPSLPHMILQITILK